MKKILLSWWSAALLSLLPCDLFAQQLFNTSHSNYSGLGGLSWNPATLADNRYRFQLQLLAVDVHAANNAYRYMGPWNLREPGAEFHAVESQLIGNNNQPKLFSAGLQVRGPGVMMQLNSRNSVAFGTRVRAAIQGHDISDDLLQDALDQYRYRGSTTNNQINLNMNAYTEWNFSYGRVLKNHGPHFLKAGLTVKRLVGISSFFFQGRNIAYEVGSRRYPESDTTLRIQQFDGVFGYANPEAFSDLNPTMVLGWLMRGKASGGGWGTDVGIVYEFRPDSSSYSQNKDQKQFGQGRNKYRFRVSAALTDLGAINYFRDAVAYNDLRLQNVGVHNKELNGITLDNYPSRGEAILNTSGSTKETEFMVGLPTALNVDVDYHVFGKIYLNAAVSHGLRGRDAIGMRHFSYATFSPRLETKWVDIALAISKINNYQLQAYGLLVRLGPITVGSNNILGLAGLSNPDGANAFIEFSLLSLASRKKKGTKIKKENTTK